MHYRINTNKVDCRNIPDAKALTGIGFEFEGIGKSESDPYTY